MSLLGRSTFVVPTYPGAEAWTAVREGASFGLGTKWLASLLALALLAMAARHADAALLQGLSWPVTLLGLMAVALVIGGYWNMLSSRTAIDESAICQTGLLPRRVLLADIVQLKLIRLRGLEWLVTPRLVVRARGQVGTCTFHCADPGVLEAIEVLAYGRAPASRGA